MNPRLLLLLLAPLIFSMAALQPSGQPPESSVTPTPTFAFVEPPLPENPTDFELGRNVYWHWCMTCHGDRGQGLTDEFRRMWDPDHQNCWARGCHAGRYRDDGFPIPTIVPALADDSQLAQFSSLQGLEDYLTSTHPPQSPGILKAEEYHALAVYLFAMNHRSTESVTPTPNITPTPTIPPVPEKGNVRSSPFLLPVALIPAVVVIGLLLYFFRKTSK